jgi:D-alanyl-lipoteichoic acid acyltransferase DltB (MBOAT superfamily)
VLFNSLDFIIFLCVVLPLYFVLRAHQRALLLAASLFFYGYWNPPYLILILISVGVDYVASRRIAAGAGSERRLWLGASILTNLGILGTFKYYGFFMANAEALAHSLGLGWTAPAMSLLLPMGISFYTFQSMAYTIDVYRSDFPPIHSFWRLLLFVTFFPQLVAGPIMRPAHLVPQLADGRRFDPEAFSEGMVRVARGLIKKLLFADTLGVYSNLVFSNPGDFNAIQTLLGVYAFAIQIYCDFSGYSDIAIGVARAIGYRIPENFDHPYESRSITEFWRRWHMSLSTWLRDYLYIPLGGNRKGPSRTYINLMLTMLIGGLWHGAAWNFVFWGGIHGGLLAVERVLGIGTSTAERMSPGWSAVRWIVTLHLVCFAWIFFRADGLDAAFQVLLNLVQGGWSVATLDLHMLNLLLLFVVASAIAPRLDWPRLSHHPVGVAGAMTALGVALLMMVQRVPTEFIYFQF